MRHVRCLVALLTVAASLPLAAQAAFAEERHHVVHTTPGEGGFIVGVTDEFGGHSEPSERGGQGDEGLPVSAAIVDIGTALFDGFCRGTNYTQSCDPASVPPTIPAAPPVITNALVLRALRRVGLPASELGVQPPGGETLVNFETNFFTEAGAFTRTVRLLGRRVELRVWPSGFRWVFGDGSVLASRGPGARYPDLEITHAYRVQGAVRASVDTTYAARFRVDGGPWRDVVGTVRVAGEPVRLRVRTARPVLVSYR